MKAVTVTEDCASPDPRYVDLYTRLGERRDVDAWVRHARAFGPQARILELGCGAGGVAIPLARQGYEVCGVDFHPGMIKAAGRAGLPNLRGVVARIETLALEERFDIVIAAARLINRLELFPDRAARDHIYAAARRHLRPGGIFCLEVDCLPWFLTVSRLSEPQFRIDCDSVDRRHGIWQGHFVYLFDDVVYRQRMTSRLLSVSRIRAELRRHGFVSAARPFLTNPADLQLAYRLESRPPAAERGHAIH